MEQEAIFGEMLSMAQATRRSGGIVIVQVKRIAKRGTLPAKQVKIPGILVDSRRGRARAAADLRDRLQPGLCGRAARAALRHPALPLDARKVIARRAAMELFPGAICNLGSGISTGIANVAAEEDVLDEHLLTNEQGLIGGAPASGSEAGASRNYAAMVDQPYQFDFYDGGGLDLAFLSFAEVDAPGNVNVSRFGDRIVGPGGFINISQNAKCVIFSGTFTAGKSDIDWPDGAAAHHARRQRTEVRRRRSSRSPTAAATARERGQRALYVTERAVFRLGARRAGADRDRARASTSSATCSRAWASGRASRRDLKPMDRAPVPPRAAGPGRASCDAAARDPPRSRTARI